MASLSPARLHSTRKTQICAQAIAPAVCNLCDLLSIRMRFVSRYWCSMENAFRLLFSYVSFGGVEIRNRSGGVLALDFTEER